MTEDAARQAWNAAWVKAWGEMPDIKQGKTVEVPTKAGGKFSFTYAPLDYIIDTVKPILTKYGFAISQSVSGDDGTITVQTILYHEGGHAEGFGPTPMPAGRDPKDVGSAITYARRYALAAALCIASDEDNDAPAAAPKKPTPYETVIAGIKDALPDADADMLNAELVIAMAAAEVPKGKYAHATTKQAEVALEYIKALATKETDNG